jgi:hypothetical protein
MNGRTRAVGFPAAVGGVMTAAVASAQVPAVPAAPAPAVPVAPAAVPGLPAAPAAAPPRNLWSFFMLTPEQRAAKEAKKAKFCRSPVGQLLNNVTKPLAAVSGGLIGGGGLCCPPDATDPNAPKPEDLNKPATDAEGAAARIKQLEADAAERRAAVRYLGTVNCRRFPEAEAALVGALRTDTNECVRFEAALALTRGCCCTKKTIEALTLVVTEATTDGNPPEDSPRVRAAAARALAGCVSRGVEAAAPATPPEQPPETPPAGEAPTAAATAERAAARQALDRYAAAKGGRTHMLTGRRSVLDAWEVAAVTHPAPPQPMPAPKPAAQAAVVAPTPMPPAAVVAPAPPQPLILPDPVPAAASVPAAPAVPPVAESPEPPLSPAAVGRPPAQPPVQPALPPTGKRSLFEILRASVKIKGQ